MTSGEWLKLLLPVEPSYYSAITLMPARKARVRGLSHSEQSINTETTPIMNTQETRPKWRVLR